jgi:hypothetical protein
MIQVLEAVEKDASNGLARVEKANRKINVISADLGKLDKKVDRFTEMVEKVYEVVLNQASGSGTH